MSSVFVQTRTSSQPLALRRLALPAEHGGWGFLLEPIVAGLAIAFSAGGAWIALMTIGAFLTRQPLKMLVLDRKGQRDNRRALAALAFVILYAAVFAVGLSEALRTTGISPVIPFIAVLPLVALQNYYDIFRRSRHIVPELAGSIAITASIACIALAGGLVVSNALALWGIFVMRLLSSIIYVRERLLLEKGKSYSRSSPIAIHVLTANTVAVMAVYHLASVLTFFAFLVLLYRAVRGLSPRRKKLKAIRIGIHEVIYGLVVVISVIAGALLGI